MKFYHSGDLGDIIAALPVIRQLGGGRLVIGSKGKTNTRESMAGARYEVIRPLLEAQPYIESVEYDDAPNGITHDFSEFRAMDEVVCENLAQWQGRVFGITNLDLFPWLYLDRKPEKTGTTIFARSARYHNSEFPWKELYEQHRENAYFVGGLMEWQAFQESVGRVCYANTKDLLHAAQTISGASLFVGNQSCPCWLAMGLGVPVIQEVWMDHPNSIVVRDNARFIFRRNQIISTDVKQSV